MLVTGLLYGMQGDSVINELQVQDDFFAILDRMRGKREREARAEVAEILRREGKAHQLTRINDSLYVKLLSPGKGPDAKVGDVVYARIDYIHSNGDDLGIPSPEQLKVGAAGMPQVLTEAFCHLAQGESARFYTSALALFGRRADALGLDPEDLVIVGITLNDIVTSDTHTDSANLPVVE